MFPLLLLGCFAEPHPAPDTAAPPAQDSAADCGTWASVGHPFVLSYCASCHSSRLSGDDRYGGTPGVDLDTLASVLENEAAFFDRALSASPDMPPRGGVPAAERAAMEAWFRCGAPGDEAPLPQASRNPTLVDAMVLTGGLDATEGGVRLYSEEAGLPWAEQRFVLSDGAAWLASTLRLEDGVEVERVRFDPPIAIYDPAVVTVATTSNVRRDNQTGWTESWESWAVTRALEPDPDPRLMEPAPWRVVATRDGEVDLQWWLSPTRTIVGQAARVDSGAWFVLLNQNPAALREADDAFPAEAGVGWATRGYWTTVAP